MTELLDNVQLPWAPGDQFLALRGAGLINIDINGFVAGLAGIAAVAAADASVALAALVARMTVAPSADRQRAMIRLIASLMGSGVWDRLDALWILAAQSQQAALLNWKGNVYNLSAVNSPPFMANVGFKNVPSTGIGFLATGFTGGGVSDNWQSLSATAGVFTRVDGVNPQRAILGASDMGLGGGLVDPGSRMMPKYEAVAGGTVNSVSNSSLGDSPWTEAGSYIATRTSSTQSSLYHNGLLRRTETVTARQQSLGLNLMCENFGGTPNFFSDDTVHAFCMGAGMTQPEIAQLHAAVTTYLVAVGA